MRTLVGAAGAFGFVGGHLSGVVGCDFCTGRTGNGWMLSAGATDWVRVVDEVVEVVGEAWCVEWQPSSAPSRTTVDTRAATAPVVEPKVDHRRVRRRLL